MTGSAPGRINIIGEHTDYNDGFVLPATIDKRIEFVMERNGTSSKAKVIHSSSGQVLELDLQSLPKGMEGWPAYVVGVLDELGKIDVRVGGFEASFEGNVPIGAGLSSSAALGCSFAIALNKTFDLQLDPWEMIRATQMAEHNYVGIKCGIMDPFASMMGRKDQVMLLDCRSLEYQYFPIELGDYELVLLNSNVSHTLVTTGYNDRRDDCEAGLSLLTKLYPGITSFRDLDLQQLLNSKDQLPERIFRRCRHVFTENQRVLDATQALQSGDIPALGKLLYQSHDSLQHEYEVSCAEIDFLVDQTREIEYVLGARIMGGGFGGCTINLVERSRVDPFMETMSTAYREKMGLELTPIQVSIGDGALAMGHEKK